MVIAISIILFGIAIPSYQSYITQAKVTAGINQLAGLIQLARQSAVSKNQVVTVCPSSDGINCSRDWRQGQILFTDNNKNHVIDENDQLIKALPALDKNHNLTWKAFQNKKFLQYSPAGFTRSQNGTFRYCVDGENLKYNRALIINKTGRVRISKDESGDGVHEDREGKQITCN